ncbi:hypothetical protein [Streptomyces sp. NPDC127197]|uniref:hypothetical protein n=1 Tax=Streptomyces sp. NPDC127197 TaxID=3345388 RepID=UPI00363EF3DF
MMARRVAEASALLAVFSMLVGCSGSGEKKEFQVPNALCGVAVDRNVVSELLPPGKQIEVEEKHPVHRRTECQVNVDGKAALIASQEWWEDSDSIVDVAASVPQLESAKLTDESNTYIHSGTGAVMKTKDCASPDHPDHTMYTALEVHADGVDNADATKRLITAYTQAIEDSDTCR